jgi:hypothetical protein
MYLRSDSAAGVRFLVAVVGRVVRLSQTGSTPSTASPAETSGRLLGSDLEDRRSEYVEGPAWVFPE